MFTPSIGLREEETVKIWGMLEESVFNSIRKVLPDRVIRDACTSAGYAHRYRLLTPTVIVLHMLLAAIWPEESLNAAWEVLWCAFKSKFPHVDRKSPSRGSVAKARARLPLAVWHEIFQWVSRQAQEFSKQFDKWKGHRVALLDGTCFSMPDTKALHETFGTSNGNGGKGRYPLAKFVAVSLARTMTVVSYAMGHYNTSETVLAAGLLEKLQKGDLLLADRHFAAAHYYVRYQRLGLEFLTRVHQRLKISRIKRVVSYSENDFVGQLKVGALYRKRDSTLPRMITVRFIRSRILIRGSWRTVWMATSLLDSRRYPACEVVKLYASRWRIETLFKEIKIKLSADVLRSMSPEAIRKEVAARITALNVVRTVMLEAAMETGVDPLRISFSHALRAILFFAPALAISAFWKLPVIYDAMLIEIANHLTPQREGRNEPRMIRRDPQHYPRLKTTRKQWRNQYAA